VPSGIKSGEPTAGNPKSIKHPYSWFEVDLRSHEVSEVRGGHGRFSLVFRTAQELRPAKLETMYNPSSTIKFRESSDSISLMDGFVKPV